MPASLKSYNSYLEDRPDEEEDASHDRDPISRLRQEEEYESDHSRTPTSPKSSPLVGRRSRSARTLDERSSLLGNADAWRTYNSTSIPATPRFSQFGRQNSGLASLRMPRNHSRTGSVNQRFSQRLVSALTEGANNDRKFHHI